MVASKKILITGGCGFIGLNLIDFLIKNTDWDISILDNLSVGEKKHLEKFPKNRIDFFKGDILIENDVKKAIKNCQYLVHLAAQTDVINSIKNPIEDAKVNILGLLNLLNSSVEHEINRFVFASSAAPLGEQIPPIDEKKVPSPVSPYGASKLAGEGYCSAFAEIFNKKNVVLRFSNVYGPHSYKKESVVANFIKKILFNETLIIYGDGNQTRDFIHVNDIISAIYLSLTKKLKNNYYLFQIGTGQEISINKLYKVIKDEFNKKGHEISNPIYKKSRKGEIFKSYCNVKKAKEELGFKPDIKINNGIKDTLDWFLKNNEFKK